MPLVPDHMFFASAHLDPGPGRGDLLLHTCAEDRWFGIEVKTDGMKTVPS